MRYEYKFAEFTLARGLREPQRELAEFGADGWEVVSVWPEMKGTMQVSRMLLKRPLSSKQAYRRKSSFFSRAAGGLGWSLR